MNHDVGMPISGNPRATENLINLRVDPSLRDRVRRSLRDRVRRSLRDCVRRSLRDHVTVRWLGRGGNCIMQGLRNVWHGCVNTLSTSTAVTHFTPDSRYNRAY